MPAKREGETLSSSSPLLLTEKHSSYQMRKWLEDDSNPVTSTQKCYSAASHTSCVLTLPSTLCLFCFEGWGSEEEALRRGSLLSNLHVSVCSASGSEEEACPSCCGLIACLSCLTDSCAASYHLSACAEKYLNCGYLGYARLMAACSIRALFVKAQDREDSCMRRRGLLV